MQAHASWGPRPTISISLAQLPSEISQMRAASLLFGFAQPVIWTENSYWGIHGLLTRLSNPSRFGAEALFWLYDKFHLQRQNIQLPGLIKQHTLTLQEELSNSCWWSGWSFRKLWNFFLVLPFQFWFVCFYLTLAPFFLPGFQFSGLLPFTPFSYLLRTRLGAGSFAFVTRLEGQFAC